MSYRKKYLKYKNKYIILKNSKKIIGGAGRDIILTLKDVPVNMRKTEPIKDYIYIDNNGIIGTFTGEKDDVGYIYITGVYDFDGQIHPKGVDRINGIAAFESKNIFWTAVSNKSIYNDFISNEWGWNRINNLTKNIIIERDMQKKTTPEKNDVMIGDTDGPSKSYIARFTGIEPLSTELRDGIAYTHEKSNNLESDFYINGISFDENNGKTWVAVENNSDYNNLRKIKEIKIDSLLDSIKRSELTNVSYETEAENIDEFENKLKSISNYNDNKYEKEIIKIIALKREEVQIKSTLEYRQSIDVNHIKFLQKIKDGVYDNYFTDDVFLRNNCSTSSAKEAIEQRQIDRIELLIKNDDLPYNKLDNLPINYLERYYNSNDKIYNYLLLKKINNLSKIISKIIEPFYKIFVKGQIPPAAYLKGKTKHGSIIPVIEYLDSSYISWVRYNIEAGIDIEDHDIVKKYVKIKDWIEKIKLKIG